MRTLYKVTLRKEYVVERTVLCTELDDAREMVRVWRGMLREWEFKEDEKTNAMYCGDWTSTTYFFKSTRVDVKMYTISIDNHCYIEDGKIVASLD